jgi:hypothetical protein
MSKRVLIGLIVLIGGLGFGSAPGAQDKAPAPPPVGWQKTADLGLNFNQSSYSNSWAGSETAAISWTMNANLGAEKQLSPKLNWRNTLKLSFGQTHQEARSQVAGTDKIRRTWLAPEKSTDRIFFETLGRATLGYLVDPFVGVTLESQFYDPAVSPVENGHSVTIRRFVHPMLITESAGIGRTITKNERTEFYSRLGFAVRERLTREVVSFDPKRLKGASTTDGGLEWVTDYTRTFGTSLKWVSKLRAFKAFFNSESDDLKGLPNADYWKTTDVGWENTLSASVAKYVQVSLFFELLYDKEIDLRGRFRETLGLGVAYKLF